MKKLNELLGTEFPIIQGGMANIATGEFAAACSNAGALGVIATGGMLEADLLRQQIRICKSLTDKPFGVNLMLMNPCADEMAQIIIEEGVQVVTTGAGSPGKYIPAWKEAGIKVLPVVAASILAKRLVNQGADAIIAIRGGARHLRRQGHGQSVPARGRGGTVGQLQPRCAPLRLLRRRGAGRRQRHPRHGA